MRRPRGSGVIRNHALAWIVFSIMSSAEAVPLRSSPASVQALLDAHPHPAAVFGGNGRCSLASTPVIALGIECGMLLDEAVALLGQFGRVFKPWRHEASPYDSRIEIHVPGEDWIEVTTQPFMGDQTLLTVRRDLEARRRDEALAILLDRRGEDAFHAGAEALARALSYRWAGIARFRTGRHVEMIGWWSDGVRCDGFEFDIAVKPCRVVAAGTGFTMFPAHVASLFPADSWLSEHGAQCYAGQVYFGPDGQPWGHVLAVHDEPDVETASIRHMMALVSSIIGADLQRSHLAQRMEGAERLALTDPLTGLGNRRSLDRALESRRDAIARGDLSDATIVCIDLDGFKSVNDDLGHAEGDRLLKLFADGLGTIVRQSDGVFRVGGDEFTIVIDETPATAIERIEEGVAHIISSLKGQGFSRIDASLGQATLRESSLDPEVAIATADRRMYKSKRRRR